jgi:hypothetical protein
MIVRSWSSRPHSDLIEYAFGLLPVGIRAANAGVPALLAKNHGFVTMVTSNELGRETRRKLSQDARISNDL